MARALPAIIGGLFIIGVTGAHAQTLRGSETSMQRQNAAAKRSEFSFLQRPREVSKFADLGLLVRLPGNSKYLLAGVSYPYARPVIKTFVERLSAQYKEACGEKLVVTSLTRPVSRQPRNASELSVHPAGMAVDLRVSRRSSCRRWLETTLLYLEKEGSVDATREYRPSHYHVAVFPDRYLKYIRSVDINAPAPSLNRVASTPGATHAKGDAAAESFDQYRVRPGDTLSGLAKRFGTSVAELRQMNSIKGSQITAGQKLTVPASSAKS
jgi:LysM repeat protein